MMPGIDSGSVTSTKACQRSRAEIGSRIEQIQIQPLEIRVQRQDHERQVRVDDAEIHGEIVVEHRQRLGR